MWRVTLSLVTILVCLFVQVKASPDISLEDLLERLVTLEDWKRVTETEVSTLRETVAQQGVTIQDLERELDIQANLISKHQSCTQNDTQAIPEHKVDTEDEEEIKKAKDNRIITTGHHNPLSVQSPRGNKRQIAGGVAFTAYLDHDVTQGNKQTIKFNKIITNDGSAYSIHTGVFTCPEAGVYLFSFFLGERGYSSGGRQLTAELVVNSQHVVGAVVESVHNQQDVQGGNTAVVRLNYGDAVWIDALGTGEHVEGSPNVRLSTFTGVYMYA